MSQTFHLSFQQGMYSFRHKQRCHKVQAKCSLIKGSFGRKGFLYREIDHLKVEYACMVIISLLNDIENCYKRKKKAKKYFAFRCLHNRTLLIFLFLFYFCIRMNTYSSSSSSRKLKLSATSISILKRNVCFISLFAFFAIKHSVHFPLVTLRVEV